MSYNIRLNFCRIRDTWLNIKNKAMIPPALTTVKYRPLLPAGFIQIFHDDFEEKNRKQSGSFYRVSIVRFIITSAV